MSGVSSDTSDQAGRQPRPCQAWYVTGLLNLVRATVCLAISAQVLALFGRWHFAADLATHFRFQIASVLLAGGAVLRVAGLRRWGATGLALGIFLSLTIVRLWWPPGPQPTGPQYRLAVMNVLTRNPQRREVARYLQETGADILLVIEADHAWEQTLNEILGSEWPHTLGEPRSDNFGLLLFSKHPLEQARLREFGSGAPPAIDTQVRLPTGNVRMVGIHPLPPMSETMWNSRNMQLASTAADVGQHKLRARTLLAGDLNCSRWSYWFGELMREGSLRDTCWGFGVWPTWYALPSIWGGLAIDHVCVGSEIAVKNRTIGPYLGSDHRAVVVDFHLATPTPR